MPQNAESNLLFIWNDDPFSDSLRRRFGDQAVITSNRRLIPGIEIKPQSVVVLAELTWEGLEASQFYGFDVVRDLRAKFNLLCPITICSFMPEECFLPRTGHPQPERKCSNRMASLLSAPLHRFVRLPVEIGRLVDEQGPRLTEELRDDIVESLCNINGLVFEELHRLKNNVVGLLKKKDSDYSEENLKREMEACVNRAFDRLEALLPYEPGLPKIKADLLEMLKSKVIAEQRYDYAIAVVSSFYGRIDMLLPKQISEAPPGPPERTKWKALFIDDKPEVREEVRAKLDSRGISCEVAASGAEALRMLDDDKSNSITVVIADYRLIEPDSDHKWQGMQGYSILKTIFSDKTNMAALFALTATHFRLLMRIAEQYQMKVLTYLKEDILRSDYDFNPFAESVLREGEKMFEAIHNSPTLTSWKGKTNKNDRPLKDYYRFHRLSIDYEDAEKEISETAKEIVDSHIEAENNPGSHKVSSLRFQAALKEPYSNKVLKQFRIRLIGRRIALGLHLLLDKQQEEVFQLMREAQKDSKSNSSPRQLLNAILALSLEADIPDHILVEERQWLKDAYGWDFKGLLQIAIEGVLDMLRGLQNRLYDVCEGPFFAEDPEIAGRSDIEPKLDEALKAAQGCRQGRVFYEELEKSRKRAGNDEKLSAAFRIYGIDALYMKYKKQAGDHYFE